MCSVKHVVHVTCQSGMSVAQAVTLLALHSWLLLEDDTLDMMVTRLREATPWSTPSETRAANGTGLDKPDELGSRETRTTCIGRVLIGMKELCRDNGLDEAVTAELVGQLAIDLCAKIGDDFPI